MLDLIQYMWNTAAEPALRGQLLAGVAGVSLAAPQEPWRPSPASSVRWDRGLLEERWGGRAARRFNVSERELHGVWLGGPAAGEAQFTADSFSAWLREHVVDQQGSPRPPAEADGARGGGAWC